MTEDDCRWIAQALANEQIEAIEYTTVVEGLYDRDIEFEDQDLERIYELVRGSRAWLPLKEGS